MVSIFLEDQSGRARPTARKPNGPLPMASEKRGHRRIRILGAGPTEAPAFLLEWEE